MMSENWTTEFRGVPLRGFQVNVQSRVSLL
jgi:hypothetical protein